MFANWKISGLLELHTTILTFKSIFYLFRMKLILCKFENQAMAGVEHSLTALTMRSLNVEQWFAALTKNIPSM